MGSRLLLPGHGSRGGGGGGGQRASGLVDNEKLAARESLTLASMSGTLRVAGPSPLEKLEMPVGVVVVGVGCVGVWVGGLW